MAAGGTPALSFGAAPAAAPAAGGEGPSSPGLAVYGFVRSRGRAARAGDAEPGASAEASAKGRLERVGNAVARMGWVSFWLQLAMGLVSGAILVFSAAFSGSGGAGLEVLLTLFGTVALLFSTGWTFGYVRLGRTLRAASQNPADKRPPSVDAVAQRFRLGLLSNLAGLGVTLLALEATVGFLVAKTLTNATANPFLAGAAQGYNPVLALDVFLVQAAVNVCIGHFGSLAFNMWLQRCLQA